MKRPDAGCAIAIRVTTRSSKPGIGDWRKDADGREELEIRVSAAPTDGEANAAVIKLLAKKLGIPRSSIEIVSGESSRHKRIALAIDEAELRTRLS
ncbi:DUF167 domain-containing protein [Sphingomonas sp. G124]|uniref:UPF0235 protein LVY65_04960 n=1 Tax=Sphingomonas cremea TaxID=2904799 RepID=A0A9X1QJT9_9SPHN|nr:DUF167 domain-containing protein [Sphingomonas cremea]MCF2514415.1 DUF167 domain-containing protein [Sphingomonas cremea]